MIGKSYPLLSVDYIAESDTLLYIFLSRGHRMVIPKAIAYTPVEKGGQKYYNLGFGDLVLDQSIGEYAIDDTIESNNGDVKTVFYTVVATLFAFFEFHPNAIVHIKGSNRQRTNVYSGLIERHWREIEPIYLIFGSIDGKIELFESGIEYEYLLIQKKNVIFIGKEQSI